jgi:mono/diheme cytochrome c family protein
MRTRGVVLSIAAVMLLIAAARPVSAADIGAPEIFRGHCARCHQSSGDRPATDTKPLRSTRRGLADCDRMSMMSDATLFLAIHDGGAAIGMSHQMPPFKDKLSYRQIAALVAYVRQFCGE